MINPFPLSFRNSQYRPNEFPRPIREILFDFSVLVELLCAPERQLRICLPAPRVFAWSPLSREAERPARHREDLTSYSPRAVPTVSKDGFQPRGMIAFVGYPIIRFRRALIALSEISDLNPHRHSRPAPTKPAIRLGFPMGHLGTIGRWTCVSFFDCAHVPDTSMRNWQIPPAQLDPLRVVAWHCCDQSKKDRQSRE